MGQACAPQVDYSQELRTPAPNASKKFRTAKETSLSPSEALAALQAGNTRYVAACAEGAPDPAGLRTALATDGQNPFAVVIGCADSRCPVETAFDAQPGDIFVLRNAGNACPSGEGSIVASSEYAVAALGTKLVVVMGHTKCGAMVGATKMVVGPDAANAKKDPSSRGTLEQYLHDLTPAAKEVAKELGSQASVDDVAAKAIRVNVLRTIKSLLEHSATLREKVRGGGVQMHGAVYDIESGKVEFLGQHPEMKQLLQGGAGKDDKAIGA